MKTIKLMDADVYKDHGFYETDHGICVEDNGTLIDISAFSASDITDPEINLYAYFQWHYDFSKSTKFPVAAVLRSPSGNLPST